MPRTPTHTPDSCRCLAVGPMNGSIILGSLMVIVSGYNYQTVR